MYSMYAHSHFYWGSELGILLILLRVLDLRSYLLNTCGPWIVVVSLLFAPILFNPNSFSLNGVKVSSQNLLHGLCSLRPVNAVTGCSL